MSDKAKKPGNLPTTVRIDKDLYREIEALMAESRFLGSSKNDVYNAFLWLAVMIIKAE